jgi:hypothetical protein
LEIVTQTENSFQPPILITPHPTNQAMEWILNYTPKLNFEDGHRVDIAVQHYEPYINFDVLLDRVGYSNDSSDGSDGSGSASSTTGASTAAAVV